MWFLSSFFSSFTDHSFAAAQRDVDEGRHKGQAHCAGQRALSGSKSQGPLDQSSSDANITF